MQIFNHDKHFRNLIIQYRRIEVNATEYIQLSCLHKARDFVFVFVWTNLEVFGHAQLTQRPVHKPKDLSLGLNDFEY